MDRPLFFYGTLQDPDQLAGVIGRRVDPRNVVEAVAPGFAVVAYGRGNTYPAMIRQPGGSAKGRLVFGISAFEREVIDAFEGADYRRDVLPVIVEEELHEAEVYLPTVVVEAGGKPWSLGAWQENHKASVVVEDAERAAAIRARLIGLRPN
jgi:gamma-glutamylcyclotransferase (GGCT)/AIG2-like uncharacterized protein YtfP